MLPLDSDQWHLLQHAYGEASNIPDLLRALPGAKVKQNTDTEPWASLWSSLCHQRDVYSASYAALPHIVDAAESRLPEDRADYLFLASAIEAMRHRRISPVMESAHEFAYKQAIRKAIPLTLEALEAETDKSWFQGLLAALAAFRGYPDLSQAVANLERVTICPKCDGEYVQRGYEWFDVSDGAA